MSFMVIWQEFIEAILYVVRTLFREHCPANARHAPLFVNYPITRIPLGTQGCHNSGPEENWLRWLWI